MNLLKDSLNKSYFEAQCEKYGFEIKYMQFLHATRIEFILNICCIMAPKKALIAMLNEDTNLYRKYTTYSFDDRIRKIRHQLFTIKSHAELFNIDKNIKPLCVEKLHDLVDEYYLKLNKENK